MSNRTLAIDAILTGALAVFVLIVSPGAAVTGLIAVIVLIACAISFTADSRARRTRAPRRASRR